MVCAGGVCQLCAAARSRRLLIKQAVLPPNPNEAMRAAPLVVIWLVLAVFFRAFFSWGESEPTTAHGYA